MPSGLPIQTHPPAVFISRGAVQGLQTLSPPQKISLNTFGTAIGLLDLQGESNTYFYGKLLPECGNLFIGRSGERELTSFEHSAVYAPGRLATDVLGQGKRIRMSLNSRRGDNQAGKALPLEVTFRRSR